MKKLRKQSVKAAIGRMTDDINGDNNRKVLQTLRDAMFEQFDGNIIGNVDIEVYDVQKAVSEYSYYFKIEFVDVDNPNDSIYLYIVSDEQSTGKFKCYLTEYTISEPFDRNTDALETFIIRMSGSKSALSHEIKRIAGGIYTENSSKGHINASRKDKNMKKFIKADELYPENYNDLGYEGLDDAVKELNRAIENAKIMLSTLEGIADEYDEWGGSTPTLEMFAGPDDAMDFAKEMGKLADKLYDLDMYCPLP